jgi:hypothetical protein
MRFSTCFLIGALTCTPVAAQQPGSSPKPDQARFEEIARFKSEAARQGVAADADSFYPVTDQGIAKHEKKTGKLVAEWKGPKDGPIIHLDSGAIVDGKLYAAHSNYPQDPMTSSVEVWDPATMQHVASHSFGIMWGSLTWIDRHDGAWWAVFANYSRVFGQSQRPYGNTYWTTLVKFDDRWQWQQAWTFPPNVLKRAEPMSISGGSWGADGLLYVTGHDYPELYALRLPKMGSVLEQVAMYPIKAEGQGIAWDRSEPDVLWMINRSTKEVIAQRLIKGQEQRSDASGAGAPTQTAR